MLPAGTIADYQASTGSAIPKVGAPLETVLDLLDFMRKQKGE